jgi:signal transduction histidine kinase
VLHFRCIFFALHVLAGLLLFAASAAAAPKPENGAIDLTQWNFLDDGTVSLAGDWQFYGSRWANETEGAPSVVQHLPGEWESSGQSGVGYGTYTLTLRLPDAPAGERFAIRTGYLYSAYRVYANGALIAESGVPSSRAEDESARAYHKIAVLPEGAREVELKFEVSNHVRRSGGAFIAPAIGLESNIVFYRDLYVAISFLLVGAMVSAAAYHFLVVALVPAARASFWFALLASALAVRTLLIEPLAPNFVPLIGQDWVWRIDFAATIGLLSIGYQFFYAIFPQHLSARLAVPLASFCGTGAAISILFGAEAGHIAVLAGQVILPFLLVYAIQAIGRAAYHNAPGGRLAFLGWILSAITIGHDYLLDLQLIQSISLIPFGFAGFLLCLSGTLTARYSDTLKRTTLKAEDLEAAVAERTHDLRLKIDELNASQAALEQARKDAVAANVAKSRFIATMSHELRTPLNSILGFSEIIQQQTMGPVGDKRYIDYAAHIHSSGTHLLSLIGDVLDISKIEAGKMELHKELLDVAELCDTALRHAATRERYAADTVTKEFGEDLPPVNADQRAVLQMVINLLSNALKFTPPNGRIVLSARLRDDGGVSIEVADSGIGMDPNDIPKALSVYSQVDDGKARRHDGTGLGLPIVKALIELHGGALAMTSEKGKGTTVRLDFPPADKAAKAA